MTYHKHKQEKLEDTDIIFCSECGKIIQDSKPDMELRKCDICGEPLIEGIIRNDIFTGQKAYICNRCKRRNHL